MWLNGGKKEHDPLPCVKFEEAITDLVEFIVLVLDGVDDDAESGRRDDIVGVSADDVANIYVFVFFHIFCILSIKLINMFYMRSN